ncbi:MAG: META domain-containing protein [Planctomycetota bacterium]
MTTRTTQALTTTLALAGALSLTSGLAGCSTEGGSPGLPGLPGLDGGSTNSSIGSSIMENALSRLTGDWSLDSLRGADLASLIPAGGSQNIAAPNLSIADDGAISGFSGVNRFTSAFDPAAIAQGNFDLSPAAMTRMAGTPEAMTIENQFMSALSEVTSFDASSLADGVLRLLNDQGAELLKFVRPV